MFVLYGTTIEAAHRHGRILGSDGSSTHSISEKQNAGNLTGGTLSCAECLICQLHQHFSTSLAAVRDISVPTQVHANVFSSAAVVLTTRSRATNTGRAPPFIS